ncbi:hypothetical protein BYT27DRAFT_7075331 [Phlegmacium glaucopus]|nr:hypothetical protein BYT27DRAFT_7075331 [Phlegmacium glaucopus]
MFTLHTFTTILAFLSLSVQASPLLLAQRDVIAPPIIKPDATSVWPVGTQQIVIWDTSNFPPDSQITNPIGQIILGFNESNSLNLNLNQPLAQGFKLRDGNVTITVPDVPPRDDYLIVLFGDSGDTSPSFAITRISSPGSGTSSSSASLAPITVSSTATAPSLSVTGSVTTAALTESTSTGTSITTASLLMGTITASTGSSSSSSSSASTVTSALAATTSTSAGWSMHHGGIWISATPFLSMAPLIMLFIV